MAKIVVVEDDIFLQEELIYMLQKEGFEAVGIAEFSDVVSQIVTLAPDLILLDINLPGQSGYEICRKLRAKGIGPILMLTSRNKLQDELQAFHLGADDYVTKPYSRARLLARMRNLLERFSRQPELVDGGSFLIDSNTFTLYKGSESLLLSANEGKILLTLVKCRHKVVSKTALRKALWGTSEFIDENALQVNVTRLRKTLSRVKLDNQIETVRGQGYRLREQVKK